MSRRSAYEQATESLRKLHGRMPPKEEEEEEEEEGEEGEISEAEEEEYIDPKKFEELREQVKAFKKAEEEKRIKKLKKLKNPDYNYNKALKTVKKIPVGTLEDKDKMARLAQIIYANKV